MKERNMLNSDNPKETAWFVEFVMTGNEPKGYLEMIIDQRRLAMHASITERTCLVDIDNMGMSAGLSGFIYYEQCHSWFSQHGTALNDYITADADRCTLFYSKMLTKSAGEGITDIVTEMVYTGLELYASEYRTECKCEFCTEEENGVND